MTGWGDTHILETRTKRLDQFSYKLNESGRYGLDVAFADPEVNEREMSVTFPFADGNRRDGVGDLLEIEGIRTERHRLNPVVLFDHSKHVVLPIGLAEHPDTKAYTVTLHPDTKQAKVKAFYYQGSGLGSADRSGDHALFCEQLFHLVCSRFIRAGSIGYQAVKAMRLPANPMTGVPEGLHLIVTNLLEVSQVVVPANQDTVLKTLSMPTICGKALSPYLVKSLEPYAGEKKVQLAWDQKALSRKEKVESHNRGFWKDKLDQHNATGRPTGTEADDEVDPRAAMERRTASKEPERDAKALRLKYRTKALDRDGNPMPTPRPGDRPNRQPPTPERREAERRASEAVSAGQDWQVVEDHEDRVRAEGKTYRNPERQVRKDRVDRIDSGMLSAADESFVESMQRVTGQTREQILAEDRDFQVQMLGNPNEKAIHIERAGSQSYRVVDRGKTGEPSPDRHSVFSHRYHADEAARRFSEQTGQGIIDETRPPEPEEPEEAASDEKRMQSYENPLSNNDVPPAKWKPGVGVVKSLRLKYRVKANVQIRPHESEQFGYTHYVTEWDRESGELTRTRAARSETEANARAQEMLNAQREVAGGEKAVEIRHDGGSYLVENMGKDGRSGEGARRAGSRSAAVRQANTLERHAGGGGIVDRTRDTPADPFEDESFELADDDSKSLDVAQGRMKVRRRGTSPQPVQPSPSPLLAEPGGQQKDLRLKYRAGQKAHRRFVADRNPAMHGRNTYTVSSEGHDDPARNRSYTTDYVLDAMATADRYYDEDRAAGSPTPEYRLGRDPYGDVGEDESEEKSMVGTKAGRRITGDFNPAKYGVYEETVRSEGHEGEHAYLNRSEEVSAERRDDYWTRRSEHDSDRVAWRMRQEDRAAGSPTPDLSYEGPDRAPLAGRYDEDELYDGEKASSQVRFRQHRRDPSADKKDPNNAWYTVDRGPGTQMVYHADEPNASSTAAMLREAEAEEQAAKEVKAQKGVHITGLGQGYTITNRGKTGREEDAPASEPTWSYSATRGGAEGAARYMISRTAQQNATPIDDTEPAADDAEQEARNAGKALIHAKRLKYRRKAYRSLNVESNPARGGARTWTASSSGHTGEYAHLNRRVSSEDADEINAAYTRLGREDADAGSPTYDDQRFGDQPYTDIEDDPREDF